MCIGLPNKSIDMATSVPYILQVEEWIIIYHECGDINSWLWAHYSEIMQDVTFQYIVA